MAIDVKSAIICDDIRTEDNGKRLLIGVYTGDILFTEFPVAFAPSIMLEFVPFVQGGAMEFEMKLEAPTGKKSRASPGSLEIANQTRAVLIVNFQPVDLLEPGPFRFLMRPKGGRWTEVLSKDIRLKTT